MDFWSAFVFVLVKSSYYCSCVAVVAYHTLCSLYLAFKRILLHHLYSIYVDHNGGQDRWETKTAGLVSTTFRARWLRTSCPKRCLHMTAGLILLDLWASLGAEAWPLVSSSSTPLIFIIITATSIMIVITIVIIIGMHTLSYVGALFLGLASP